MASVQPQNNHLSIYHRLEFDFYPQWRIEFAGMSSQALLQECQRLSDLLMRIRVDPSANGCNCNGGWYVCEACTILSSRRSMADCFLESFEEALALDSASEPELESQYETGGNAND